MIINHFHLNDRISVKTQLDISVVRQINTIDKRNRNIDRTSIQSAIIIYFIDNTVELSTFDDYAHKYLRPCRRFYLIQIWNILYSNWLSRAISIHTFTETARCDTLIKCNETSGCQFHNNIVWMSYSNRSKHYWT